MTSCSSGPQKLDAGLAADQMRLKRKHRLPEKAVVSVETSVCDDYLVCLADGVRRKMLTRHLRAKYEATPDEYREHFGLPRDYPMVAPGYVAERKLFSLS